ncbi:hypothetical protein FOA52_012626 [Chlamydomonas sp. UWO 241]|nr:hypothetical protein FOA52_012626 [Chlamydomonas sp. UWO 241]
MGAASEPGRGPRRKQVSPVGEAAVAADTSSRSKPPPTSGALAHGSRPRLRLPSDYPWLKATVVGLTMFAVTWIFVTPGTWMAGTVPGHQQRLEHLTQVISAAFPVPSDVITKYEHFPFVRFAHILGSSVWAAAAAVQVQGPQLPRYMHRASAIVMLVFGIIVMAGFAAIELQGLSTKSPDAGIRGHISAKLWVLCAWFLFTAFMAGRMGVRARRAWQAGVGGGRGGGGGVGGGSVASELQALRFEHSSWGLRHIASGIWVLVQRLLIGVYTAMAWAGILYTPARGDDVVRSRIFLDISTVAIVLCIGGTEAWLWAARRRGRTGLFRAGLRA